MASCALLTETRPVCLGTSIFLATKYNSRRSLHQSTLVVIVPNMFPLMLIYGLKTSVLNVWMCVQAGVTNQIIRSGTEHNINNVCYMRGCEINECDWKRTNEHWSLSTRRTVCTQKHADTIQLDTISSGISQSHVHVIYPAVLVHLFP